MTNHNAPRERLFEVAERDLTEQPIGTFADEVDVEKMIRQTAEALARRGEQKPVEPIPPKSIPEGESIVVHVLDTFSLDGYRSRPHARGATVIVTHDAVNKEGFWDHRHGVNTFDRLLSEGKAIKEGPWPTWMPAWTFGSREWAEQRAQAVLDANAIHDREERAIALAAVTRVYGPSSFNPQTAADFYRKIFATAEAVAYFEEQGR